MKLIQNGADITRLKTDEGKLYNMLPLTSLPKARGWMVNPPPTRYTCGNGELLRWLTGNNGIMSLLFYTQIDVVDAEVMYTNDFQRRKISSVQWV